MPRQRHATDIVDRISHLPTNTTQNWKRLRLPQANVSSWKLYNIPGVSAPCSVIQKGKSHCNMSLHLSPLGHIPSSSILQGQGTTAKPTSINIGVLSRATHEIQNIGDPTNRSASNVLRSLVRSLHHAISPLRYFGVTRSMKTSSLRPFFQLLAWISRFGDGKFLAHRTGQAV